MTPRVPVVLGIAGSPRRHGNSEQLLDACLSSAAEVGGEIVKVVASQTGVLPCRGCNACSLTGECVVRDGMREVYRLLDAADAIVVGSPVYFATVPAVLKTIYDRCQPYWARRHVLLEPAPRRRPGAMLLVRGGGDPYGFEAAKLTTKSVFAVLGVDCLPPVEVEPVDSPSDLGRHPEGLARARETGATLVKEAAARLSGDAG
ncbi:MAG: flavodoxin family protein [Coriobacteriia bacterium]